ncbi:hypothetical protein GCM10029992_07930 [Glycomyces albus]
MGLSRHTMNDNTSHPGAYGVDVPLSVWPVWSRNHLIECLVKQFTVAGETVALLGVSGASAVVEAGRDCVVVCDARTAAREHAALLHTSQAGGAAVIVPIDASTGFDRIETIRDTALTICAPRPARYTRAWALAAATVRQFGLLAVIWDGPLPPDAAASCEEAGLSYAGHIVAADVGEFDRAATTAEDLESTDNGRPSRSHVNVSLWARLPEGGGR